MRFPGVSVDLHLSAFFARDPCRDPYGIGQVVFGRLVCPLFYAAAILLRSALYGRLGILALTFVQKCPTLAFWPFGLVVSPSCLLRSISGGRRSFFSEKK